MFLGDLTFNIFNSAELSCIQNWDTIKKVAVS